MTKGKSKDAIIGRLAHSRPPKRLPPLVFLVNALDKTGAFELIHEGIIDEIFDADVGDFRIELGQQFVQPPHALKVGVRHPLVGINHGMIRLLRICPDWSSAGSMPAGG